MDYIVSVSGGKDSTAVLLYMLDRLPKEKVVPVFMDTKWEADETYEYLNYLEEVLDVEIIRIESMGMFELCKMKKMVVNRQYRFCTEYLKIRPFEEWLKENYLDKNKEFTVCVGIRREESTARENTPVFDVKDSLIRPKFKKPTLAPIVDWTKEEVFDFIKQHGIKHHPFYDRGFDRVGCMPCIFARKNELMFMPKKYKERLRKLEAEISEYIGQKAFMFHPSKDKFIDIPLLFTYEDLFEEEINQK